jgi:hydrogenase maturation protease
MARPRPAGRSACEAADVPEEAASVQRVVVIGYGNSLRGDDGFGRLAAELIEQRHLPGLEVIVSHQLGPELAQPLSEADHAVFLDAEATQRPGVLRAAAVEPHDLAGSSVSHHLDPGSLIALTRAVYGRTPSATLITAPARNFRHGAAISDEVRAAAVTAAGIVAALAMRGPLGSDALRDALAEPR